MQTVSSEDAARLRLKYPTHVPVVVHQLPHGGSALKIKRLKYLVPQSTPMGSLCSILRKYMEGVTESTGLFFYVRDVASADLVLAPMGTTVGELDVRCNYNASDPGRVSPPLAVWVAMENTFGGVRGA
jgi:hypothetical protein